MNAKDDVWSIIPDTKVVRSLLAVALTEAALLRAQLKVSSRKQKEWERLVRQGSVVPSAKEEE